MTSPISPNLRNHAWCRYLSNGKIHISEGSKQSNLSINPLDPKIQAIGRCLFAEWMLHPSKLPPTSDYAGLQRILRVVEPEYSYSLKEIQEVDFVMRKIRNQALGFDEFGLFSPDKWRKDILAANPRAKLNKLEEHLSIAANLFLRKEYDQSVSYAELEFYQWQISGKRFVEISSEDQRIIDRLLSLMTIYPNVNPQELAHLFYRKNPPFNLDDKSNLLIINSLAWSLFEQRGNYLSGAVKIRLAKYYAALRQALGNDRDALSSLKHLYDCTGINNARIEAVFNVVFSEQHEYLIPTTDSLTLAIIAEATLIRANDRSISCDEALQLVRDQIVAWQQEINTQECSLPLADQLAILEAVCAPASYIIPELRDFVRLQINNFLPSDDSSALQTKLLELQHAYQAARFSSYFLEEPDSRALLDTNPFYQHRVKQWLNHRDLLYGWASKEVIDHTLAQHIQKEAPSYFLDKVVIHTQIIDGLARSFKENYPMSSLSRSYLLKSFVETHYRIWWFSSDYKMGGLSRYNHETPRLERLYAYLLHDITMRNPGSDPEKLIFALAAVCARVWPKLAFDDQTARRLVQRATAIGSYVC